jgi:ABC-type multidrug transport system permease subunit
MLRLPKQFEMRPVYFREVQSNMYSPVSYFLGRLVADIPLQIIEIFTFSCMAYWLAGLTSADSTSHFWLFIVTLIGCRICGTQFIETFGALFATLETANTMVSVMTTIFTLFSGFLIQKNNIPSGWIWMYYLSYTRYPLAFLAANELITDNFNCQSSELITAPATYNTCPGLAIPNPAATGSFDALLKCPIQCGQELLDQFGISSQGSDMAINAAMIWVFACGFAVLNYLALRYINHIKR